MDPGQTLLDAQGVAERTALAWQRTFIGVLAVGALVVRWTIAERLPAWPAIVLVALVGFAGLFLVRWRYERVRRAVRAGQTPASRYLVPGAAIFVVAVILGVGAGILFEYTHL